MPSAVYETHRLYPSMMARGRTVESRTAVDKANAPKLKRVLGLWDLVYYGLLLTSPIAVVPLFGVAQVLSRGHAIITILAAMVAMTATAVSFGRMATVFPSAGSVYTYASRAFHPIVGFVVGWAMFLEYLFQPLQNSLYAALTVQRLLPHVPFALLSALAVGFMTTLCWFGIRATARTNEILLAMMSIVMMAFLGQAISYILRNNHLVGLISSQPIYDPTTFSVHAIAAGTALTATTFIGFDGSAFWPKRLRTRGAMFCLPPSLSVYSREFLPQSRFTWQFAFGLITALWLILKPPLWMWRRLWAAINCSRDLALCCSFQAWQSV